MNIIFLCSKIFLIRIIDVTLGTIRTIYTVKDKILIASIIGFLEVLVWFLIAKEALDTTNSILIGIFYSLGFACGTYIGGIISKKVIQGNLSVQIITEKATNKWLDNLREQGFAVSVLEIRKQDNHPDKYMFFLEINKNDLNRLFKLINNYDENAFIVINESKAVVNGYFKRK